MAELRVLTLRSDRVPLYRDWLRGRQTSLGGVTGAPDSVVYVMTPPPWTFWVAVATVCDGTLRPLLTFKNPVPLVDLAEQDALSVLGRNTPDPVPLGQDALRLLHRRLNLHNHGLRDAVASLPRTDVRELAGLRPRR